MKYSVILGNVGSCCDRYVSGGYSDPFTTDELFDRVASIENVDGIELVGGWHIREDNVDYIKSKMDEYKFKTVALIPDHFGTQIWGKGAFTSPDKKIRELAVKETGIMAEAARMLDCKTISIWNGQDGYDYPLQANYSDAAKWLTDGLRECAQNSPDINISIEYKPKEPRTHSFLSNVWSAVAYSKETNMPNVGITIDVGHSFEAYENVAEAISIAASRNLLFHMHVNDNYRLWDDDMITGSIHTIEYLEMFYWLKKMNYNGFISVDQYPYREDGRNAVEQSIKWLMALEKAADRIDREKMDSILAKNDAIASTQYVREIIFG